MRLAWLWPSMAPAQLRLLPPSLSYVAAISDDLYQPLEESLLSLLVQQRLQRLAACTF
jgi:hypothetical protein